MGGDVPFRLVTSASHEASRDVRDVAMPIFCMLAKSLSWTSVAITFLSGAHAVNFEPFSCGWGNFYLFLDFLDERMELCPLLLCAQRLPGQGGFLTLTAAG